ncbi:MAG: YopX family protein [Lysinibacillus sp.]
MNKKFNAWFEAEKRMVLSENLIFEYDGREDEPFTFAFDDTDTFYDENNEKQMKGTMSFVPLYFTGLTDRYDKELYDGDITTLEVEGETRHFKVAIKTVVRELLSHPSFADDTAKIVITGVVFEWNDFELFPCVDENGVPDNKRMKKVGNIYENPELLYEGSK